MIGARIRNHCTLYSMPQNCAHIFIENKVCIQKLPNLMYLLKFYTECSVIITKSKYTGVRKISEKKIQSTRPPPLTYIFFYFEIFFA